MTVPGPLNFAQGATTQAVGGISLSDVNAGSTILEATFAVEQGTLSLLTSGVTGGITASDVVNNGTADVTVWATLGEINTTLAAAGGLKYTEPGPASASDDVAVSDDLTVTLIDAADASSSASSSTSADVSITVQPNISTFAWASNDYFVLEKSGTAVLTIQRGGSHQRQRLRGL